MAQVEKKEMLQLLDSLKQTTLNAYDGKIRNRSDIEELYLILTQAVTGWDDEDEAKEKGEKGA